MHPLGCARSRFVGELLHKLDYRLQANRKTREGSHNPDRDAQFHYSTRPSGERLLGEPLVALAAVRRNAHERRHRRRDRRSPSVFCRIARARWSSTVGMPSGLLPPDAFGISTRRTGFGL
jgi:hypothetical protein